MEKAASSFFFISLRFSPPLFPQYQLFIPCAEPVMFHPVARSQCGKGVFSSRGLNADLQHLQEMHENVLESQLAG